MSRIVDFHWLKIHRRLERWASYREDKHLRFHFIYEFVDCHEIDNRLSDQIKRKRFFEFEIHAKVLIVIDQEWWDENREEIDVVVNKISIKQILRSIILHIIDICSKIVFHDDIDFFDLIVDFEIKVNWKTSINFKTFAHQLLKVRCELNVSIEYQCVEKIV